MVNRSFVIFHIAIIIIIIASCPLHEAYIDICIDMLLYIYADGNAITNERKNKKI